MGLRGRRKEIGLRAEREKAIRRVRMVKDKPPPLLIDIRQQGLKAWGKKNVDHDGDEGVERPGPKRYDWIFFLLASRKVQEKELQAL